ncbi:DUF2793 domain-containing protein [Paenirhodobacter enshiensis]|uniref:DUF2793 domain-containing protein n=1 Tax=Paenirhodobacter enshiensis TaxID=1105367 RepID=UPI00068D4BD7|nr:DUF2793 domain-containing protein [Paenirhodobacter enshiensis]
MAQRALPGLGLRGFYDAGYEGWGTPLSEDLRVLSVLTAGSALSRTTVLPAAGATGDIYIVPADAAANADQIAVWDGESGSEAWVYLAPVTGVIVWLADEAASVRWEGSSWNLISSSAGMSGSDIRAALDGLIGTAWRKVSLQSSTAAYALTDADLAGNVIRTLTSATAVTLTVPAGLTGTEPMTIVQGGAGTVTVSAASGVTIKSYGSKLSLAGQEAWATLIPLGSDTYRLGGNLA